MTQTDDKQAAQGSKLIPFPLQPPAPYRIVLSDEEVAARVREMVQANEIRWESR